MVGSHCNESSKGSESSRAGSPLHFESRASNHWNFAARFTLESKSRVAMKHSETFTREFALDRAKVNEKARSIELSFSSEQRVERSFGGEILSHDPDAINLSRLNSGGPLLWGHDADQLIGRVERAWVEDRKARAIVRFGNSTRAKEVWEDVKDGILESVSVGYRIDKMVRDESDKDTYRATKWTPYEVSFVSIPADDNVGVGRSAITEKISMKENIVHTEIEAMASRLEARIPGIRQMADQAILEGQTVETFRSRALELMPEAQPITRPLKADIKPKDWARYSISRAAAMVAENKPITGLEAEISQEIAKRSGVNPNGLFVPDEMLNPMGQRNFVAGTGTLGGMLVQTDNLGGEFIPLPRNRARVIELGARVLNLTRPATIPRQSAAGAVNFVGETVAATLSNGSFTQLTLSPQAVSAFQQYSKQLLMESNPSIDSIIRDDIVKQIGLAIDLAALHGGATASGASVGLAGTTGVNTVALNANGLALGNATAYPFLVSLETAIANDNCDTANMGYLVRAAHRGVLKTTQRFASTDSPIWSTERNPDGSRSGVVNGYRAEVSQQIATNLTTGTATTICSAIFFGDWNSLIVANFSATDLTIDPFTLAQNGVVRIIARRWFDIGVRVPDAFCLGGGLLTL
jgi:HK97 family phage major capsid protein/HK97 family phage prohead protease